MIQLPIRRCPNCRYVGPTRKFNGDDGETGSYRCPRCGHEIEPPNPRLL
ncbi:hypothetical protein [Halorussus litoreus]|nr:hypothetical protein [Halorussus litoreus]